MSKITEIEVHDITLEYCDWTEYQLNHYYGPLNRTIYVAHTDDGFVGLGESRQREPGKMIDQYVGSNPFDWCGDETSLGLGTAMYDLMGKIAGVPVHRLFGQKYRSWVPVGSWTVSTHPRLMAEAVSAYAAQDSLAILVAVITVLYLAVRLGAPLGDKADPTNSAYVPRPEWYFLGLQHLLRVFTGSWQILGTAILPGAAVTVLLLLPWLDRNRRHRLRHRPIAVTLGTCGMLAVVGLTVAGYRAVQDEERRLASRTATPSSPTAAPDADLARHGKQLYTKLPCATCHGPNLEPVAPGLPPDLSYAGSKLHQDWVASYLLDPVPLRWLRQDVRPVIRMPNFDLTDGEAAALAAHLSTRRQPARFDGVAEIELLSTASADEGRQLFEQYGCRGCHVLDGEGNRVGPDLSAVGGRLRIGYLFAFLQDPEGIIPDTPMEQIDLWDEEAAAIARFLETRR